MIDRLNKGYDESKRDTLSRELVVNDVSSQYDDQNNDYSSMHGRRTNNKHKRSMTSMAENSHHQGFNNNNSVDIRISSEKGNYSPQRERENPGPGSSRRDNESRFTTEMSSKKRKETDIEITNPGLKIDKYVIGKEF